jgi:hypothetical protein
MHLLLLGFGSKTPMQGQYLGIIDNLLTLVERMEQQ